MDAAKGLLERQEEARAEARILVEDICTYTKAGEHTLDSVAKACAGRDGKYYAELSGSHEAGRTMLSYSKLLPKIRALEGDVWTLRNGTHELEVKPGDPAAKGPGSGARVVIRKLLSGG